jgi:Flp pilus assembly protein TadD
LRGTVATIDDAPAFAESLTPRLHYGWSDLRSVRDGRWKFILAPRSELYDLARDPNEQRNLADAEPARARALRAALDRHLASENSTTVEATAQTADVPPDLVRKLAALGYASGSAPADPSARADPKDKVEEYKVLNAVLHEGLMQLRDRRYAEAADRFRTLSSHGIDSFESHYYYGQALVGLRKWLAAADEFERAIPRLRGFAASYLMLAECHVAAGNRSGALDALSRGATAVPRDPRLHRRLGDLHRDSGQLQAALAEFRTAIDLDPTEPSQWNSIGMILGAGGDLAAAERSFREAVQRDSAEARYTYNLALTLEREHRPREAAEYFRKTLALNPRFSAAKDRLESLK